MNNPGRSYLFFICVAALVCLSSSSPASAKSVDRSAPAVADGLVVVRNDAGRVRILAWDEPRVRVKGEVGDDTRGLTVEADGRRVIVEVKQPEEKGTGFLSGLFPDDLEADLEIQVPRDSSLEVRVRASDVEVADVTGVVDIATVSSSVLVRGRPSRLALESVSGVMRFEGRTRELRAESLSGQVRVQGEVGTVGIETVSGDVTFTGTTDGGELSSLSGDITLTGTIARGGRLTVDGHGGDVTLSLPADLDADFRLVTVKGRIDNQLEPGADVRQRGETRESGFTRGAGGSAIVVETYGGDIHLKPRSR